MNLVFILDQLKLAKFGHRFSYRLRVRDLYFALEVFDVFAVLVALAVFEAFSTEATSQVLLSSL